MKFTALFLCVLVATAFCETTVLQNIVDFVFPGAPAGKNEFSNFMESHFKHFNLSKPDQIIDCFNDLTADIFFKMLYEVNEVLQDSSSRNSLRVHLDYGKLAILRKALHPTVTCMKMTQDFSDLLDALEIEDRNPKKMKLIKYIYYQASYPQLAEDFKPVINSLDSNDHASAGETLAYLFDTAIDNIRDEGTAYLSNQAMANGFAVALEVNDPSDSVQCHNNDTAHLNLRFFYELSTAVSKGSIQEVVVNTVDFWHNSGKEILEKIPSSVWQCLEKSADTMQIDNKLGVQLGSKEFHELAFRYINNHRIFYHSYMKSMRDALEHHNFVHAGNIYGRFVKSIVSSKKDE